MRWLPGVRRVGCTLRRAPPPPESPMPGVSCTTCEAAATAALADCAALASSCCVMTMMPGPTGRLQRVSRVMAW